MSEKKTVKELQSEFQDIRERMQAINDTAEAAGRQELTAEEAREWDTLAKKADVCRRALDMARLSGDEELSRELRSFDSVLPMEYRLTTERAEAGKRLRAFFETKYKRGTDVELRDVITASGTTEVDGAIPVLVKDFIEPLEKGIIYGKLGIKVLTGLSANIKYPIAPYVEASIAGEKEKIADTTITLTDLKPKPQRIAISIPFTGLANIQTDGAFYTWVVNEIVKAVARTLNRWMFQTTAIKEGVYGVFAYNASANPILQKVFAAAAPTYKELLAMRGEVMATGAYNDGTYAYVMSGKMYADLEATPIATNSDRMILQDGKSGGVPVFITEEIECTGKGSYNVTPKHVGFGRFSDCMAHQFGNMRLIVDPYSSADADATRVVLNTDWSVDVVRAKSFVIGTVGA